MTHGDATMLERLARSIDPKLWDFAHDEGQAPETRAIIRNGFFNLARAILNELKQVDEGMVGAAGLAAPIGWSDKPDVEDIFTAMIDHVLSEGEG